MELCPAGPAAAYGGIMANKTSAGDRRIRRLVIYGLLTALIAMLTLFASFPLPLGEGGAYLNAGDTAIYLTAYLIGPIGGMITAAVGSAIADLLHGAAIYAPATLVIKGLMGLICGALFKRIKYAAPPVAGLIMPLGYFAFEYALFGSAAALYGLWTNAIQYAFGVIVGIAAIAFAVKARLKDKLDI